MINELICYAERKIDEACAQGEDIATIRYWVGYKDALVALKNKMEETNDRTHS